MDTGTDRLVALLTSLLTELGQKTEPTDDQEVIYATPTTAALTSAEIDFVATGANTLVAGVGGQTIRVFKLFLVVSAATNLTFRNGATDLTGAMSMAANGTIVLDFDGEPWFVTSAGSAFVLNQSGTAQVSGAIRYRQS